MPMPTPQAAADLQVKNLKGATERIKAGINAVTVSPMEKAVAAKEKMRANLLTAIDDGTWERGLLRVSLSDWKAAFLTKGVNRIGQGAEAAKPKLVQFYTEFFPFLETVRGHIASMPDLTLDDAVARAEYNIRQIATFKRAS